MGSIEKNRDRINEIDRQLASLFKKRMECVKQIGLEKVESGRKITDAGRENKVVENVLSAIGDENLTKYAEEFIKDLMEVSKRYQADLMPVKPNHVRLELDKGEKAGFQGTEGSYTEQAFKWIYGDDVEPVVFGELKTLFEALASGDLDSAVVPYENSSTGGVNAVTDLMRKYGLYIKAETEIRIEHCLLGIRGAMLSDIKYVYSHPQGLGQCSNFFKANEALIECSYANTAFAARDVAAWKDKKNAAIASPRCANLYGLDIIRDNIQDNNRNKTRFIVISADPNPVKGAVKTSILFTSAHKPGALYNILEPFYKSKINITRIESRPNPRRSFEYFFYLDFAGSAADPDVAKALEEARKHCGLFRIMGSYRVI